MSTSVARLETSLNTTFATRHWPVISGDVVTRVVPADDEFAVLDDAGTRLSFCRNETIFEEGENAKYCYRLVSGSVRLCKFLLDGRRQIADFFLADDLFGFADIDTHAFSAEAVTDVVLLRYPRARVEMLIDVDVHLRRKLIQLTHERLNTTQMHLVMLGRHTVKERIALFLIRIAERLGLDADVGGEIDLPMSRLDIADYLGLTIETVCRAISDLKRAGVIAVPNTHRIVLQDARRLRNLVEGATLLSA
ncbi:MAG: helix-turn-helix domain-containing protein [Parvibaculum sp.]|nr:helix-turn-helix domain-containing protein [Parvibaculum sp.]